MTDASELMTEMLGKPSPVQATDAGKAEHLNAPLETSESSEFQAKCAQAVKLVLASNTFAKTARLSSFLNYVCSTQLAGQGKVLSEQNIGNQVFGRPEHYNPAEDTIVRTTARLLRQRLCTYYETEGSHDAIRIVIPRGTYAPLFVSAEVANDPSAKRQGCEDDRPVAPASPSVAHIVPSESPDTAPESVRTTGKDPAPHMRAYRQHPRKVWPWVVGLVVVAALFVLASILITPSEPARVFWQSVFPADRETLLIPADSALVMYEDEVHRQIDLESYTSNHITAPTDDTAEAAMQASKFRSRRYTSVISVMFAAELAKLSGQNQSQFHVRFSRDVRLSDLKQSNAVLVGVEQANPWVQLFRDRLNFHIDWQRDGSRFVVRNDKPQPGEQREYTYDPSDAVKRGYAVLAYTRGLTDSGRVLLVGGTGSAGTEAGVEFLLDRRRMNELLQRTMVAGGSIGQFEALFQCMLQADGSTSVKLVGLRTRPF